MRLSAGSTRFTEIRIQRTGTSQRRTGSGTGSLATVLNLIVAQILFTRRETSLSKGEMTRVLSSVVSNQALDALSRRFNRAVFSRLIPKPISGQDSFGRRITGGAFDAFIGALYYEFGLDGVTFSVTAIMADISTSIIAGKIPSGSSRIISRIGENTSLSAQRPPAPDHEPFFTVRMRLSGQESFEGSGPSLAEAQKAAARKALDSIGSDGWMTGEYTGFP